MTGPTLHQRQSVPLNNSFYYPPVLPHCVFAAGKPAFEADTLEVDKNAAKALIFSTLPLAEHGWNIKHAKITRLRANLSGRTTWRLERG